MTDEQWKILLQFLNEFRESLKRIEHIDAILTELRSRL